MNADERAAIEESYIKLLRGFLDALAAPATNGKAKAPIARKQKQPGKRGRPGVPAETVAEMKKLKAAGMEVGKIAKKVGLSHFTVYKYTKGQ